MHRIVTAGACWCHLSSGERLTRPGHGHSRTANGKVAKKKFVGEAEESEEEEQCSCWAVCARSCACATSPRSPALGPPPRGAVEPYSCEGCGCGVLPWHSRLPLPTHASSQVNRSPALRWLVMHQAFSLCALLPTTYTHLHRLLITRQGEEEAGSHGAHHRPYQVRQRQEVHGHAGGGPQGPRPEGEW